MSDTQAGAALAAVDDAVDPSKLENLAGLSLSGGGFKAALYHLGALARVNELGALRRIDRISSVSGGSIVSGLLAAKWGALQFDAKGEATNFDSLVFAPLANFCLKADIDVSAWIDGVLSPFRRASDALADAYAQWLVGDATLMGLPIEARGAVPRFIYCATNVQLNSLTRFSRQGVRDWRIGEWKDPNLPLSRVMAASSAFPPIFSPMVMKPTAVTPYENSDRSMPPYTERLELADGGIYDNLGVEPIWKRCKTILVSNAGDPFEEKGDPPDDWLRQLRRTVSMMHRQAENNRMRFLMALAKSKQRDVAIWNLRGAAPAPYLAVPPGEAELARSVDVRLKRLNPTEARALLRHGYSMANAAIHAFWLKDQAPSAGFPGFLDIQS